MIDWLILFLPLGSPSDQQMELIQVHRPPPLGAARQGLELGDGDVTWQGNQLFHPPPQQGIIAGMVVIEIKCGLNCGQLYCPDLLFYCPVSEFNEFEPLLKYVKNRFQLSAGLNLEKLNTILSGTNHIWAAAQIL